LRIPVESSDAKERSEAVKSITGSISGARAGFAVLAPLGAAAPSLFRCTETSESDYNYLLAGMQRCRGAAYLQDGAITPEEVTADGRHILPVDVRSWHLLLLGADGGVSGCVRILEQTKARGFDDLWIRSAALCRSGYWSRMMREAVELEMTLARRERVWFAEVGGLAIAADRRCTTDSLRTILATFGLLQLFGGARCVATVTTRHSCAPILRRIGLSSLTMDGVELPPYYDHQYGCDMEVLRFDSRFPARRYADWVLELAAHLTTVPVIMSKNSVAERTPAPRAYEWAAVQPGRRTGPIQAALALAGYPGQAA
jgi:hypothetical protein